MRTLSAVAVVLAAVLASACGDDGAAFVEPPDPGVVVTAGDLEGAWGRLDDEGCLQYLSFGGTRASVVRTCPFDGGERWQLTYGDFAIYGVRVTIHVTDSTCAQASDVDATLSDVQALRSITVDRGAGAETFARVTMPPGARTVATGCWLAGGVFIPGGLAHL